MQILNDIYSYIIPHFHGAIGAIQLALPLILIFMALELLVPGERLNWRSTLFNIIYTPVFLTITSLLIGVLWTLVPSKWIVGIFRINSGNFWSDIFVYFFYILIFDFSYYWLHRAQHTIGWLWRYHAVHHADPNVSALTTSRHHWLEDVFRFLPIILPLSIIFGNQASMPLWALVIPGLYGIFIHWNTSLRMSLISNIIVTPWYHRIHHSLQPEHHNKNYAIFFPFWDVLFKTAHFARDKEFPNTGIESNIKPNSLRRLLPWPQQ